MGFFINIDEMDIYFADDAPAHVSTCFSKGSPARVSDSDSIFV
jgi:hypothetical protein